MAFVAEVKARLGLDTTPFTRALTKTQADLAKLGKDTNRKLERSLGGDDAVKGLLQGIGIGSVEQIRDFIVRPFQMAYEKAKGIQNMTGQLREIAQREIGALNGPRAELREMERNVRDINQEIEIQQKLVNDLNASPLKWVNAETMQMLADAEQGLRDLQVEQARLQSQVKVTRETQKRSMMDAARQTDLELKLADIELRDGSKREALLMRLKHLRKEYSTIERRGLVGTPKEAENLRGQWNLLNELKKLNKASAENMALTLAGLGGVIGRKPKPKPEGPMSEPERIASRGLKYLDDARASALKGNKQDTANFATWAARDLQAAGRKMGDATSLIPKDVAKVLSDPLLSAASSLKDIKENMQPEKIK